MKEYIRRLLFKIICFVPKRWILNTSQYRFIPCDKCGYISFSQMCEYCLGCEFKNKKNIEIVWCNVGALKQHGIFMIKPKIKLKEKEIAKNQVVTYLEYN